MSFQSDCVSLSPQEFESEVATFLMDAGGDQRGLRVERLEKISVQDGTYEIDITSRFEAFGVEFLVLVECKHHKSPIKRDVVQILNDRVRAVGGHKGIIFSTSRFQRGAVQYAQAHGVALVEIADGRTCYVTRGYEAEQDLPPGIPLRVGWFISLSHEGYLSRTLITDGNVVDLLALTAGLAAQHPDTEDGS
jgi:restriction system protein